MKFQPDPTSLVFINGLGPGWVMVNGEKYAHSILVNSESGVSAWPVDRPQALNEQSFAQVAQSGCEVALYGSGESLVFPTPLVLQPLIRQRIGLESMSTPAACRTFNILAAEGRKVTAVLVVEQASKPS